MNAEGGDLHVIDEGGDAREQHLVRAVGANGEQKAGGGADDPPGDDRGGRRGGR